MKAETKVHTIMPRVDISDMEFTEKLQARPDSRGCACSAA